VLREKELCNEYDAALAEPQGATAPAATIVNELKALRVFKQLLPE
jgi:hypothetical protein